MKTVTFTVIGAATLVLMLIAGCGRKDTSSVEKSGNSDSVEIAPGVTFVRDREAGVQLLDIDLATAAVRPAVVAEHPELIRGNFVGDARTVREWAKAYNAIGGMNAGFFGETYDPLGRRKQMVGLVVVGGKVVTPGGFTDSTARKGERFLRSVVGFSSNGTPEITWATGGMRGPLRRYSAAINPRGSEVWDVRGAVACGPRLFAGGVRHVSDREERLVSPLKVARAFIAYDREQNKPRHLILARADSMQFADIAAFLSDYFARQHNSSPREAMCLDGGPSAQLVYRQNDRLEDAEPTGVLVPTAILLLPKK